MMLLATITLPVALFAISGVTAGLLEEKVGTLEFRNVPIHYEVAKPTWIERLLLRHEGSKKALALYYYEGTRRKDLGKLFPLDISAFIEHGLAKKDDELEVDFGDTNIIARISADGEKPVEYSIDIHRAGGIDYVDLDEAMEIGPEGELLLRDGKVKVAPVKEKKLYYVRVPFNLFPELDGKALQTKAGSPFSGYSLGRCKTANPLLAKNVEESEEREVLIQLENVEGKLESSRGQKVTSFNCLMIGLVDRTLIATPLPKLASSGKYAEWYGITAKEVAHLATYRSLFAVDPTLAIDFHVQYMVVVPLTEFNRMEPEFVQMHGRLTKWTDDHYYTANLVFEKKGQTTFDLHRCERHHCIRPDEKEMMGVNYIYKYVTGARVLSGPP